METSKFFKNYFHIQDPEFLLNQPNAFSFIIFYVIKKAEIDIKEILNIFSSDETDSRVQAES